MDTKIIPLFLFVLILTGLASASSFQLSTTGPITFSQNKTSTFTIANTSSPVSISMIYSGIKDDNNNDIPLSITGLTNPVSSTETITISSSYNFNSIHFGKLYSGNINASDSGNSSDSQLIAIQFLKSFCSNGETSNTNTNLSITDFSVSNKDTSDDLIWNPLNNIEVKIEVANQNSDDANKISTKVKLGLYNSNGNEKLKLSAVNLGSIKGGDSKTAAFTFKIPSDLKEGNYFLYAKAYQSSDEADMCTSIFSSSYYKSISVEKETDDEKQVVLTNMEFEPGTATCSEEVVFTANAVNIGTDNQDKIKTTIYNSVLGVSDYKIIDSLDEGESVPVSFSFKIPGNATDKTYVFELRNLYSYDGDLPAEDSSSYDLTSEGFYSNLLVTGCSSTSQNAAITASLQTEDVKAGSDVIIKATLTNTGQSTTTYNLALQGADSFSTVKSISPSTLTLDAGKSQDVIITLNLNDYASGEQVFSIQALFNGKQVTQQVSLSIPQSSTPSIISSFSSNWFIWVIVLINIILIIAIIWVAVRVSRA